ncbi:unnamed protein product [Caenorhabditis auriculariae]|uniref:Uncharacterized protein n=1 Tax=Caenorhabditis auriculariae TaxID=2777116 RepID=A0A8S1HD69_9PELO|nr:unnamed protein product [Caenorhabditis auriculariae]
MIEGSFPHNEVSRYAALSVAFFLLNDLENQKSYIAKKTVATGKSISTSLSSSEFCEGYGRNEIPVAVKVSPKSKKRSKLDADIKEPRKLRSRACKGALVQYFPLPTKTVESLTKLVLVVQRNKKTTWRDEQKLQLDIMQRVIFDKIGRFEAVSHVRENWSLIGAHCALSAPRNKANHELILSYTVNSAKLFEVLLVKGVAEISTYPSQVVYHIIGKFLLKMKPFSFTSKPWNQAKEVLQTLLSTLTIQAVHYSLVATLSDIQRKLIRVWATRQTQKDDKFLNYAIGQLCDFIAISHRRLSQIENSNRFGLSF